MDLIKGLTANYYINVAITAWFLAQLSKTLLTLVLKKKLVMERMIGAGGMPSSHTALVCSLTIAMARKTGVSSAEFALALALACIVMYDAMGVRRAAGEHAKVLNKLVFGFQLAVPITIWRLGMKHSVREMGLDSLKGKKRRKDGAAGMLLGILVAMIFPVQ